MCGRYVNVAADADLLSEFDADEAVGDAPAPSWNVAPTDPVRIVVQRPPRGAETDATGETPAAIRQLRTANWGLVPSWSKDRKGGARMINARIETVTEKPAFKTAAARRRCLIPALGYYEWQQTDDGKVPHFLHDPDGDLLAMAGLYELWRDHSLADDDPARWLWTCTIITEQATDLLGEIHDRNPVVVPRRLRAAWLDCSSDDIGVAVELLGQLPEARLDPYVVGPRRRQRQEQPSRPDRSGRTRRVHPTAPRALRSRAPGMAATMPSRTTTRTVVETPGGPAWFDLDRPSAPARAVLLIGHGAGGGVEAPDIIAVRNAAVAAGFAVARITQPYRVAGRRAPAPAPRLDEAWLAITAVVLKVRGLKGVPAIHAGRSSGARVACRTATAANADAVVALAFPVHPPGRPDKDRLDELTLPVVPVLVVQGDRDPFGMPPPAPGRTIIVLAGADHSLKKGMAQGAAAVVEFVTTIADRARVKP